MSTAPKRKSATSSCFNGHSDVLAIKQAASGHWLDILTAAGIPAESLDGDGHPCPKCGGTDRFAGQRDFADRGAVICRRCFAERNGDGLAAVAWIRGIDFPAAVRWVAELLRTDTQSQGKQSKPKLKRKRKLGRIVATYDYRDESGNLLFQVVRDESKGFLQRRPDGKGGWTWSVKGVRVVPYLLPELLAEATRPVFVAEGEKDCDNLARIGVLATSNAGGAGKWTAEHSVFLQGRPVAILPDNDEPGRTHARKVAESLQGVAASVRVVELPGLPDKGDASDWIGAGGTREELERLANATPDWTPDPVGYRCDKSQSTADQLVELAKTLYTFGRSEKGEPFAVLRAGPNVAVLFKGSNNALRAQLASKFRAETGRTPGGSALADALNVLTGESLDAVAEPVHLRVARHGEAIVVDLGDTEGRAVIVRSSGWKVVDRSPVLFRRTALTSAILIPEGGGTLDELRGLLNVTAQTWPLVLGWLIAALIPDIPHPILLLSGLQGSGKSCAARILVRLIDASAAPLRSEPRKLDDWQVAAAGSWVVALDNISAIPTWLADALCRAATGDGLVKRALFTDDGLAVLAFKRAIILTSIDAGAIRGDLGERLLLADLDRIDETGRRTEQALESLFAKCMPRIFGAILDALAAVMATLPDVQLDRQPRMADFARVLAASDSAGVTCEALACYLAQSGRIATDVIDGDSFAQAIFEFVRQEGTWKGTASELLKALLPENSNLPAGWPKSNGVSGHLKRLKPALETNGIRVTVPETRSSRGRIIELESTTKSSSPSSHLRKDPEKPGVAGDDAGPDGGDSGRRSDDTAPTVVTVRHPNGSGKTTAGDDGDGSGAILSSGVTERSSRERRTI
ncbi:MAG: hypothetical protein J5I93_05340 [Pirellulaceae bacterium]|nr:hypothetical protein [Pirellulaceae bacterium]